MKQGIDDQDLFTSSIRSSISTLYDREEEAAATTDEHHGKHHLALHHTHNPVKRILPTTDGRTNCGPSYKLYSRLYRQHPPSIN